MSADEVMDLDRSSDDYDNEDDLEEEEECDDEIDDKSPGGSDE